MDNKKKKQPVFQVPTKDISSIFFHPAQEKILVTSQSGGLLTYQIGAIKRPFEFKAKNFTPTRGIIIEDSEKHLSIIGASAEGKIALWKQHSADPVVVTSAHNAPINDIAFLKQTGEFITASNDKVIKLWDSSMRFISSFTGHKSQVTACACAILMPSDPRNARQMKTVVVSGDQSGTVILWDLRHPDQGPVWDFHMHKTKRDAIKSIDIDAAGKCFCILTENGHLGIFNLENPEFVVSRPFRAKPNMMKMHPTKPYVLCTGSNNNEMVYSYETNSLLFSFEGHAAPIVACAWSPNGRSFATADSDGIVIIWRLPKLPKSYRLETPPGSTVSITSPPPMDAPLPLEVLAEELNILTEHVHEYSEILAGQESRISRLEQDYRWRM